MKPPTAKYHISICYSRLNVLNYIISYPSCCHFAIPFSAVSSILWIFCAITLCMSLASNDSARILLDWGIIFQLFVRNKRDWISLVSAFVFSRIVVYIWMSCFRSLAENQHIASKHVWIITLIRKTLLRIQYM
jgi:hypothetical protein